MNVIFHSDFTKTDYSSDGAAVPGRMEAIMEALRSEDYNELRPFPASETDIALAHEKDYIEKVQKNPELYKMAALAVGGAILAAEKSIYGEPSFACVRPPGHHAYPGNGWGYCHFGNMAIALLNLRKQGRIGSAFVLDFDAHTGDGTKELLSGWKEARILNPMAEDNIEYKKVIEDYINELPEVDIVAVSAGFDSYKKDLGRKLETFDFYHIGRMLKLFCKKIGHSRRFAVLEGGYYLPDLGKNVLAFCQGFD